MADLTRSARSRRSGRRPGWLLLTVLLVLAIVASSALVFTNRVELLKLAVILALWAAVVAAFVSVIYRRQSDMDQAKVRDLKLVYDLQLDREISARREYELSVETQLRRELVSELRAQAADEVAGLRAELAALRANLEILFDADLSHRPAIETVRGYSDWAPNAETTGRVSSSRIDTEDREERRRDNNEGTCPHRGKPDHRRSRRTASAGAGMGARTGVWRGSPPTLRVAAPGSATPGIRAGKPAKPGGRDAAARVVAATPGATPADARTAAATDAAAPADARAPIPLAATATRAAEGTRTTAAAASAPRDGARRSAGVVDGMEAGARRGGVDSGRDSRQ